MRITIDRIDQGLAVCECEKGENRVIAVSELPEGAIEGTILAEEHGIWTIDRKETEKRRQEMKDRLKRLTD